MVNVLAGVEIYLVTFKPWRCFIGRRSPSALSCYLADKKLKVPSIFTYFAKKPLVYSKA